MKYKLFVALITIVITGSMMLIAYGYTYIYTIIVDCSTGNINGAILVVISVGITTAWGTFNMIEERNIHKKNACSSINTASNT